MCRGRRIGIAQPAPYGGSPRHPPYAESHRRGRVLEGMKTIRIILIAISTLTAMLAFATSSNAATTTVKLHTDADTTRFLADSASGLASMDKTSADDSQRWRSVRGLCCWRPTG